MNRKLNLDETSEQNQKGQSIVIIALVMVGLLAFAGLAVDVGMIFARSSQLQAAVDAAALAAVTETVASKTEADIKARQFLKANDVPISVTLSIRSSTGTDELKGNLYSLTATWPVNLFFLQFIGRDIANVTKSATAAYYTQTDIYASRRAESGVLSTSNQAVFGPHICIDYGDPFSPLAPGPGDPQMWEPGIYAYRYRILIPGEYSSDTLRVEIFDPDSYNDAATSAVVTHSNLAVALGAALNETINCSVGNRNHLQMNPCLLETGETNYLGTQTLPDSSVIEVELDHINPYWFIRIDENRGTGPYPGNGTCSPPPLDQYDPGYNTQTVFKLSYFRQNDDGTTVEIPLTQYTGQVKDAYYDTGDHDTDMRWVSPGGALSFDQTTFVPVDSGSSKTFELNIANDLPNIVTDPNSGARYVYLSVSGVWGSSENGFEIWAGPPDYLATVPSDVNERNLYILDNPRAHSSEGATVFGLGRLPMNSNYPQPVDIPLLYIPAEYAGQSVKVSLFDTDAGALPPITFYFDSIPESKWSLEFGTLGEIDGDGVAAGDRSCVPGNCRSIWVDPPYDITVPGVLDNCDYDNITQEDCTPFYGGRLVARYQGGQSDTYGWQISLTGVPYLVE